MPTARAVVVNSVSGRGCQQQCLCCFGCAGLKPLLLPCQGGDADSNACVAGAMLGCKLGLEKIPDSWKTGLKYRDWLDEKIDR